MRRKTRKSGQKEPDVFVDCHSDESISDDESSFSLEQVKRSKVAETVHEDVQWYDKYAPNNSEDICINPRKLKEVKEFLNLMVDGFTGVKLLILTGPAGSAKSTAVKILANEIFNRSKKEVKGLEKYLEEYGDRSPEGWIEYLESSVSGANQSAHFESFLNESKYKTNCVVLIEDLPNVFEERTLKSFRSSILQWIHSGHIINLPPLVLCISETQLITDEQQNTYYGIENNISVDTLLTKEIADSNKVKCIRFNPIAASFMKKTINNVISKEWRIFSKISKSELSNFVNELIKIGDIRSVLANLQMWSSLKAKYPKRQSISTSSARENKLNLFHAIGKILYSSSEFKDLKDDESDFQSIEAVIANSSSNNLSLLDLSVAENYSVINNGDFPVEIAANILDNLSISDMLLDSLGAQEVGIRAARTQFRKVTYKSSRQIGIKFPRYFKMLKHYKKASTRIHDYQKYIAHLRQDFNTINLIDGYYLPLIYNSKKYRAAFNTTGKVKYNRIGGRFEEIYANEAATLDEELADNFEEDTSMDQFKLDIIEYSRKENEAQHYEDEVLSDPIETSDDDNSSSHADTSKDQPDDDVFDDSLIDKVDFLMAKHSSISTNRILESDDFSSDPELDVLISSRQL